MGTDKKVMVNVVSCFYVVILGKYFLWTVKRGKINTRAIISC